MSSAVAGQPGATQGPEPVGVEPAASQRILVVGLGGIGGVIAGRLRAAGQNIAGVTRNEAIRTALERDGFQIEGCAPAPIGLLFEKPPATASFDLILIATQPPQVEAAAVQAMPALAPGGAIVVLPNGLCEERVSRAVGQEHVVGAIIAWGASMIGPGLYRQTSQGGFTIGLPEGPPDDRCRALARLLTAVGPTALTDNLRGARWTKLAFNCAVSTLGTVGGARLGPLLSRSFVRRLGLEVMTEVVAVAQAEGVRLEKLAGTIDLPRLALTPAEKEGRGRWSMVAKHGLLLAAGAKYRRLRSSMLAAIERGRPPAVDFLNGEVVSRAQEHGIAVPVNDQLLHAVHRIAAGEMKSSVATLRSIYEATR